MGSGKKAMAKMDTRIRELCSELDAENRRLGDAQKNFRRSERQIKELTYAQEEDRKNHERMQGLIEQLQGKVKSYKKQGLCLNRLTGTGGTLRLSLLIPTRLLEMLPAPIRLL